MEGEETELSLATEPALDTEGTKLFLVQCILIYSEAARLQYEEAERLMDIALTAKAHADELLARCADLVAENLGIAQEEPEVVAPKDDSDIPW